MIETHETYFIPEFYMEDDEEWNFPEYTIVSKEPIIIQGYSIFCFLSELDNLPHRIHIITTSSDQSESSYFYPIQLQTF